MRVLLIASLLLLGACSSSLVPDPIGIGTGVHDLKRSPCACNEIPMQLPQGVKEGRV
jgi:hypothetical protein